GSDRRPEGIELGGTQRGTAVRRYAVGSRTRGAGPIEQGRPVPLHARHLREGHAVEGDVARRTPDRVALRVAAVLDVAIFGAAERERVFAGRLVLQQRRREAARLIGEVVDDVEGGEELFALHSG